MAAKIKLMRLGKVREPHYRIVVAPAQSRRNGKVVETIGQYHPTEHPSYIHVDSDRAQYWLGVGARPTEPVQNILEITGDWQKFKGLPGSEGTLQSPAGKPDKAERFAQALAAAEAEPTTEATTPRRKGGRQQPEQGTADKSGSTENADASHAEQPAEPAEATESGQA